MIILIDSREKLPFSFGGKVETKIATLTTGDYSVAGLEDQLAIERKSLADLISSLSTHRERFNKTIERLRGISSFGTAAIVCEGSMKDVLDGAYMSRMSPVSAYGSIMGVMASGVPLIMAGSRTAAERACYSLCRIAHNRAQYKLRNLAKGKPISA